jgi:hypothetical protein
MVAMGVVIKENIDANSSRQNRGLRRIEDGRVGFQTASTDVNL